tara:strand:- start:468 stop:1349 length:882 start_codon:yes stop_codon:yes gene_type:complete
MLHRVGHNFRLLLRKSKIIVSISYILRVAMPQELKRLRMLAMLVINPEKCHKLISTFAFPTPSQRLVKTSDAMDDFQIIKKISDKPEKEEISHIIMKGKSFDRQKLAGLSGKIYLVNWQNEDKINLPNIVYTTGDQMEMLRYIKNEMFPILLCSPTDFKGAAPKWREEVKNEVKSDKIKKIYFSWRCGAIITGSGLHAIVGVQSFSKIVHIHGWDTYIFHPIDKFPGFLVLFCLLYFSGNRFGQGIIETNSLNWMYAARLMKNPRFRINGIVTGISKQTSIMRKIERIYYNSN